MSRCRPLPIGQWAAHDVPLTTARDLRYDQFIFGAVDERAAGASGCSIDALVRRMKGLQAELGCVPSSVEKFWRSLC